MLYIHNKVRFRQSGTTMQKRVPPSEAARRARVRKVHPGFPVKPFERDEDIAAYVSDTTICCLMCGRHLQVLGMHLRMIHNMDLADYRERFNIPWTYPLAGREFRERVKKDGFQPGNKMSQKRKVHATGYRAPCKLGLEHIADSNPNYRPEPVYFDFSWHLKLVATTYGSRPEPPEGVASWATFKKRRLEDPELYAAYKAARAARPVDPKTIRRRNKKIRDEGCTRNQMGL